MGLTQDSERNRWGRREKERGNIPIRALKNASANLGLCINNLARLAFFLGSGVAGSRLPASSFICGVLDSGCISWVGLELHIVYDICYVRWESCEDAVLREMVCVLILLGGVMKG
jgi:hypothetical protein